MADWRVVCGSSPRYGRPLEPKPGVRILRRAAPRSTRVAARATRVGSRPSPRRRAQARSRRCDPEAPSEVVRTKRRGPIQRSRVSVAHESHRGSFDSRTRTRSTRLPADGRRTKTPARIPGRATACRQQRKRVVVRWRVATTSSGRPNPRAGDRARRRLQARTLCAVRRAAARGVLTNVRDQARKAAATLRMEARVLPRCQRCAARGSRARSRSCTPIAPSCRCPARRGRRLRCRDYYGPRRAADRACRAPSLDQPARAEDSAARPSFTSVSERAARGPGFRSSGVGHPIVAPSPDGCITVLRAAASAVGSRLGLRSEGGPEWP
jgi:hypothetical protein